VLRAELEIVERSNHGLTVGYVPLGADATVSEGSVDFKFKNNLDDAVYLEAYTYSGNVYVCIYGKETRPSNRTIEFYSVTEQTIEPGDDVITEDDTQPEGYQEVTQTAHNGYVASFYKYVYVDGELQEKIKLNTSTYRATPRYVTVGTKKEKETEKVSDDEEQD
jgi:vancomycin resistance protein YoaR